MINISNRTVPAFLGIALLFCLLIMPSAKANFSYGARATGMGGAFTAMADDGSLVYWNPGSLILINGWIIELQYGSDGLFADDVRDTMDGIRGFGDGEGNSDAWENARSKIWDKDWLARGGDTISLVIGNRHSAFHFTQYQIFYVQPGDGDEETPEKYQMSAIEVKEYGVTVAVLGGSGGFSLGVTGKYIDADAYAVTPNASDIPSTDPDDLYDYIESNGQNSSDKNWGLDAGIMMAFGTSRVGFTARNILEYEIEIDEDTRIEINREYRLGYAYMPTDRFVLAMDYSIDKEKDLFGNDLNGSEFAAGFEAVFGESKWLVWRGGVSMPFDGDAPMIFSVGGGLIFTHAILDFGYALDQNRDSEKVWGGVRFNF